MFWGNRVLIRLNRRVLTYKATKTANIHYCQNLCYSLRERNRLLVIND